jgi:hypothetical protein
MQKIIWFITSLNILPLPYNKKECARAEVLQIGSNQTNQKNRKRKIYIDLKDLTQN